MPSIAIRRRKALKIGSVVRCSDNTGAKYLKIIDVLEKGSRKNRLKSAKIGDLVKVTCKSGSVKYRKKMAIAIIIRAKNGYYDSKSGINVYFSDNAAVLVNTTGSMVGTIIKGIVPKFIQELRPKFKPQNCKLV